MSVLILVLEIRTASIHYPYRDNDKKMASVVLPQVVAVCIQQAIESGRTLSWRIQESFKGTSVQLFWKNDFNQESRVEQAFPWSRRARSRPSKKKSPSQVRRSRRRLDEFIKSKSQDCQPKSTLEITQDNRACTSQFVGHAADSGYVRLMTETSPVAGFVYQFNQKTVQETLAAIHIAHQREEDQQRIWSENFARPEMGEVWKVYCGHNLKSIGLRDAPMNTVLAVVASGIEELKLVFHSRVSLFYMYINCCMPCFMYFLS